MDKKFTDKKTHSENTSEDTKDKILNATIETIACKKISGTRMHLIADEAGMSQSNLHYHFPTKKDLLLAVLDKIQDYFTKKRMVSVNLEKKSFEENLHALFDEKKDDILNHKKIDYVQFDYLVQGTADPIIRDKFRHSFDIWRKDIQKVLLQSGVSDAKYDKIKNLSYIMVSAMMGASMQYIIDEGKFNLDEYFKCEEEMIKSYIKNILE